MASSSAENSKGIPSKSGLNQFQEAVLKYVLEKDPRRNVVSIDPGAKKITFSGGIRCHQQPKWETEGFVRAYLVARLVFDLGYPPDAIEIEFDMAVSVGRAKRGSKASGVERGRNDILVFQRPEGESGKIDSERLFLAIECKVWDEFEGAQKEDLDGQLWGVPKAAEIEKRVDKRVDNLCLYACEFDGVDIVEKALVVDWQTNQTHAAWKTAGEPSANTIPAHYGQPMVCLYANVPKTASKAAAKKPLSTSLNKGAFEKLRAELHNLLWAGSSADDNAIFYQLVKIFLIKIYDELQTLPGDDFGFQVKSAGGVKESAASVFARMNEFYKSACRELLNYDETTIGTFPLLVEGMTEQKIKVAVEALQGVSLTENENVKSGLDLLGSFFEGILSNQEFFKQSKGCFFTHPNIVRFMLAALEIDKKSLDLLSEDKMKPRLPYIIDPSCGSGTFLIESMKFITARMRAAIKAGLNLSKPAKVFAASCFSNMEKPNIWAKDALYGIEPRPELGLAAKVNMIMHGDGNMNVFIQDGLHPFSHERYKKHFGNSHEGETGNIGLLCQSSESDIYPHPENAQFDFVITNPPFSIKTEGLDSKKTHSATFIHSEKTNSENLFLERHWQLLRPGGRLAAVLPESVFDTSENIYIRLFLYKHFWIDGVVSLPTDSFSPFTTTKTSILFATKKDDNQVKDWNARWNKAAAAYSKVRSASVLQSFIHSNASVNGKYGLSSLCAEFGVAFEPETSLLSRALFPEAMEKELRSAIDMKEDDPSRKKRLLIAVDGIAKCASECDGRGSVARFDNAEKEMEPALAILRMLLRNFFPDGAKTVVEVCERAYDEICMALALDWSDAADKKPFSNAWWCLAEVFSATARQIFYAEVDFIGYKRTKRGETKKPNELFGPIDDKTGDGFPVPNLENPTTVLDHFILFRRRQESALQGGAK